jgi:hypothetical protein
MEEYLRGVLGFKGERGYSAYEIAVQNGFVGSEKDFLSQLGTTSHFSEDSVVNISTEGQTSFELPTVYASGSMVDIYVNGFKLNPNEYTIDTDTMKINLVDALDEGAVVEIVVKAMGTNKIRIKHHNSISNMKQDTTLEHGNMVHTLGYHEVNDGGAADYIIREKTEDDVEDNGSIIFLDNGLVAELIIGDCINSKQFGAYGNDNNDDTTALNNFFKYDTNIKKVVNQGIYKTTNTVFIEGKWRKDSETDYDNSLKYITFDNATINYVGNGDRCILFLYNHFKTTFEGLTVTRTSNNGYIDMTGVWHCRFVNFDMKCDLKMNYDTSIVNDTILTTSIHTCVFDNVNILGNIYMDSTNTYINSIHFRNCCLDCKNIKPYALELKGSDGYQNIIFSNTDISYFTTSLLKINDTSSGKGHIKFENCYFDTGLPLVEDFDFKSFNIDLLNNLDASNTAMQFLYTSDYMSNFNLYNQNRHCNSLPMGLQNLNYNGDLSYIGENPKHAFLSNDSNVTKSFVTTDANISGNALRLEVADNTQATLYGYGITAPIKSNYTMAYRIIKHSGSGTMMLGNNNCYVTYDLDKIENDKEFILTNSPFGNPDALFEVGDSLGNSITFQNGVDIVLDIVEMIIVAGNLLTINLPLHEKAKINPTADGTLIRPTKIEKGHCYFDTTLNKPIWYNGTNWVDATGSKV